MKLTDYKLGQIPHDIVLGKESLNDLTIDEQMTALRSLRNHLLTLSDWTQVIDNPIPESKKQEWTTYRQQLRDITIDLQDPLLVEIPDKPA